MSKNHNHTPRAMGQLTAENELGPGTTIVGGQPPSRQQKALKGVPVGIEKVLYTAALYEEFKKELLKDRETAIRTNGFKLNNSELKLLCMIPEAQLQATIENIDISPQNLRRRKFMRTVAASVATIAAAEVLKGCREINTGMGPDWPDGSQPLDAGPAEGAKDADTADISDRESGCDGSLAGTGIRPG